MSRRGQLRLLLVALVVALLVVAWQTGLLRWLSEPQRLATEIAGLGASGMAAFVLVYALLQPFGVPGTVFVVAAPLIWPWPVAFGLNMVGTMLASLIGFGFARVVARDWVAARIPARFKQYDALLEERAFATVALLRLILWMPQALHFFLGVSRVPGWTHFWGSLVGYLFPLLLVSYMGDRLFDGAGKMQTDAWPAMVLMWVVSLSGALLLRHLLRKQSASAVSPTSATPP
ncbi:MAG: VTT domain-containing protein [Deltaproteobacteria bacterium]|nr:VTT domain-containing protein [Deltaproteobacteria bacterium]